MTSMPIACFANRECCEEIDEEPSDYDKAKDAMLDRKEQDRIDKLRGVE